MRGCASERVIVVRWARRPAQRLVTTFFKQKFMKEKEKKYIPTKDELFSDLADMTEIEDEMTMLLCLNPKKEWLKEHADFPGHFYLPIDKVEILLNRLFKEVSVEVLREGLQPSLGVFISIRLHYFDSRFGKMRFQDGTAGIPCNKKNELKSAFQIAKSEAIKDAAHHIGKVFGRDLNRSSIDMQIGQPEPNKWVRLRRLFENVENEIGGSLLLDIQRVLDNREEPSYTKLKNQLEVIKINIDLKNK